MIKVFKRISDSEVRTWVNPPEAKDDDLFQKLYGAIAVEPYEVSETDEELPGNLKTLDVVDGKIVTEAYTQKEIDDKNINPKAEALKKASTVDELKVAVIDYFGIK